MLWWAHTDNSAMEYVMDMSLQPKSVLGLCATPLLHQTSFWSLVKKQQGTLSQAYDISLSKPLASHVEDADMLVLLQPVSHDASIAYLPYGPELNPGDGKAGAFLEELSEALRPHLPSSCLFLRYDLPWQSPWAEDEDAYDSQGDWIGPPEPGTQEIRVNWGTVTHNLRKAPTDVLPADTIVLDIARAPEDIMASMKSKTRYNIHLAHRHEVVVRTARWRELDIFYDLYRQTCRRNGIYLHDKSYFDALFASARQEGVRDRQTSFELLIAQKDEQPLAALFAVYSQKRVTYLFGASASEGRQYMGTYALQWELIMRARSRGCTEYDMFGVAPNADPSHPMYGLYRFKTGFGGEARHLMGCWDYPLKNDGYESYAAQEMTAQGYHMK